MLTVNVITEGDAKRINGSVNGSVFNVEYTKDVLDTLIALQNEYEGIDDMDAFDAWVIKVEKYLEEIDSVDTVEEVTEYLKHDRKTGHYYLKAKGKVGEAPIPQKLVDLIVESADKGLSPDPIIKAWVRFVNRNSFFNAKKASRFVNYITATIVDNEEMNRLIEEEGFMEENARLKATYNDVAITMEGLIVCKKYAELLTKGWKIDPETNEPVKVDLFPVTKTVDQFSGDVQTQIQYPDYAEEFTFEPPVMGRSGDAFLCGDVEDHIIRVGEIHKLKSWDQVDTNDDHCCVKGLHVGGMKYVQSYRGLNCQLLECFVDPAEIGAITDITSAGSDGAMRVKEYFVFGAGDLRNKGLYHSSRYAALKDKEWDEQVAEAIEKSNAETEALKELV